MELAKPTNAPKSHICILYAACFTSACGCSAAHGMLLLLAHSQIQVTSRVNNAPKSTVESVSKGSGLGTFDGFNAAAQASLSLGMLAAALLIAFIQM